MTRGVARPPKMPKPVTEQNVSFKLENELLWKLGRISIRDSISRSELLRRVVTEFVEREEHA